MKRLLLVALALTSMLFAEVPAQNYSEKQSEKLTPRELKQEKREKTKLGLLIALTTFASIFTVTTVVDGISEQ